MNVWISKFSVWPGLTCVQVKHMARNPYMYACHAQHEKTQLLPHLEPVIQPLGEAAVLGAPPKLDVGCNQTCIGGNSITVTNTPEVHLTKRYVVVCSDMSKYQVML